MSESVDALQESLRRIEAGESPDIVISSLPAGSQELAPLLRTVSAVRQVRHPEFSRAGYAAANQRIAQGASALHRSKTGRAVPAGRLRLAFVPAIIGLVAVMALCAMFSFGTGIYLLGPGNARAATLMDINGLVEVASSPTASVWTPVSSGDELRAGQVIRTDVSSSVTMLFYEGSRSVIGPNSTVTLNKLSGGWGGQINVAMTEDQGSVTSSVVPFNGKASSFLVHTSSGTASVHGTHFAVEVAENGLARYSVTNGSVDVNEDGAQVELTPGQAVTSLPQVGINITGYQFTVQGELTTQQGNTWVVDGVVFTVTPQTDISGELKVGDLIVVVGRVLGLNNWVADTIELANDSTASSTFAGKVDQIGQNTWVIGGVSVAITSTTQISAGIAVGDPVQVTFVTLSDGTRQAQSIVLLQAASNPSAKPQLGFSPSGLQSNGCVTSTLGVGATIINHATGAGDNASNVELGFVTEQGAQYVNSVTLTPASFTTLGPGETAPFKINVTFTPAWKDAKQGSTVKLRVMVTRETNRPDHLNASLNVVIKHNCKNAPKPSGTPEITSTVTSTITSTVTVTPTITITSTVTVTPTVTPVPETNRCSNQEINPEAVKLADQWGVTPQEIMGWFCQGYGFGEIDLAYSLAKQANVPVTSVFDLRKTGLGWGEIKQQLLGSPGNGNDKNNGHGNGNGNGNGNGSGGGNPPTKDKNTH